jgi:sortase family protein
VTPGRRPVAALVLAAALLAGCAAGDRPASGAPASVPPPSSVASPPTGPSPGSPVLDPAAVPAPVSVDVPALGIAEPLLDLGVAEDGTAEVPEDPDRAGWFTGGGRPGARGPTVLLGHVDSTAGPGVFARLGDLAPGAVVAVTVADGTVARYTVTTTEQVPKGSFPTAAVFGATADDVLRLITCTGDFDRSARSYVDNLVVTAVRMAA